MGEIAKFFEGDAHRLSRCDVTLGLRRRGLARQLQRDLQGDQPLRTIVQVTFQPLPLGVSGLDDPLPRRGEFGKLGQQPCLRRHVLNDQASGADRGDQLIRGTGQPGAVADLGHRAIGAGDADDSDRIARFAGWPSAGIDRAALSGTRAPAAGRRCTRPVLW